MKKKLTSIFTTKQQHGLYGSTGQTTSVNTMVQQQLTGNIKQILIQFGKDREGATRTLLFSEKNGFQEQLKIKFDKLQTQAIADLKSSIHSAYEALFSDHSAIESMLNNINQTLHADSSLDYRNIVMPVLQQATDEFLNPQLTPSPNTTFTC